MILPPYLRIVEKYRDLIDNGLLLPDQQIPSQPAIMREEGVSGATALKAVTHLRHLGYVYTNNLGTFVKKHSKPEPKLREDLSLREGLVEFLDRCGWDGAATIQDVLDEHAHKLAEQQRAWQGPAITMSGRTMVPLEMLADSIDPEKET